MTKGKWWTATTYRGPSKFTRAQLKNRKSPKFDTPKVYSRLDKILFRKKVLKKRPFFNPETHAVNDSSLIPVIDSPNNNTLVDSDSSLQGAQGVPLPDSDSSIDSDYLRESENNHKKNSTSEFEVTKENLKSFKELKTPEPVTFSDEEYNPISRSQSLEDILESNRKALEELTSFDPFFIPELDNQITKPIDTLIPTHIIEQQHISNINKDQFISGSDIEGKHLVGPRQGVEEASTAPTAISEKEKEKLIIRRLSERIDQISKQYNESGKSYYNLSQITLPKIETLESKFDINKIKKELNDNYFEDSYVATGMSKVPMSSPMESPSLKNKTQGDTSIEEEERRDTWGTLAKRINVMGNKITPFRGEADENVLDFIDEYERFINLTGYTEDEDKKWQLTVNLKGPAKQWLLIQNHKDMSAEELVNALKDNYKLSKRSKFAKKVKLYDMSQEPGEKYKTFVNRLRQKARPLDITEKELLGIATSKADKKLRAFLAQADPKSISELLKLPIVEDPELEPPDVSDSVAQIVDMSGTLVKEIKDLKSQIEDSISEVNAIRAGQNQTTPRSNDSPIQGVQNEKQTQSNQLTPEILNNTGVRRNTRLIPSILPCGRCGKHYQSCIDNYQNCPAFNQACLRCGLQGHFAVCCTTRTMNAGNFRRFQRPNNQGMYGMILRPEDISAGGPFAQYKNYNQSLPRNHNRFNNNFNRDRITEFNRPFDSRFTQNRNTNYRPMNRNIGNDQNFRRGFTRNNMYFQRNNQNTTNMTPRNRY